jgi:hypothetical protein
MSGSFKGPTFLTKLDELQEEYAKKQKELDNVGDLYSKEKSYSESSENEEFNCRFSDSCYTLKSKMGTCPCGLNEPV